ncbi:hypothetical protein [Neisseria dentiae]|uniref:hypothetical protein n=1 Tax=Neisseria dentiae TaxID=194197 RepID=UPI00211C2F4A|nr:hypothetical protein [Neisseria dentiae]MCQ9325597.1 hypothetical protein [Neisseria dentiae]
MNICVLARLFEADTAAEAVGYSETIPNNPAYGRLCLMQLASGKWAVCLCRGGG